MTEPELRRRAYSNVPSRDPRKGIDTQRGRYALGWLIDQDGKANIDTWASHVAAWEEDEPLCDVSEERLMHYYSWLYFSLVPRLVQEGLVEHHHDRVRPVDGVESIGEYLVELSPTER